MQHHESTRTRRWFLRSGVAATGIASIGVAGADSTSARTTVSGGGSALQTAIDNASDGDRLVVIDSMKYGPVKVYKDLTITTTANPKIDGGGGQVAVLITASGTTFEGFDVRNPGGLLGIKIDDGLDMVTVRENAVRNVGPTGKLGVTGIIVGQGDHDDLEITGNDIRNLDQETTNESEFPTVNGILFDADNSDPGTVSSTTVSQNTIRDVESDIAPLGIVTQHELDDVGIVQNEITDLVAADSTDSDPKDDVDFGFTFAQGINIASPSTKGVSVVGNIIADVTSAETILPEAVKIDGDGGGCTFRNNEFLVAVGLNNRNGTDDGSRDPSDDPVVDAKANYWGSPKGPEEADFNQDADDDDRADVVGNVEFVPFKRRPRGR
jgi:hypothetical protein